MDNKIIDSGPPLAGVIGYPISHSKSPKLHNYWLSKYNIEGFYIPFSVSTQNLERSLNSLIDLGFKGVNVTIPHKTTVLSFADSVTDRAALIGAANTLYFSKSGKIHADNTDGYGFIQNILDELPDFDFYDKTAFLYGAGGSSRAIASALISNGVKEVRIANRTRSKSQIISENLGAKVSVVDWRSAPEDVKKADIIVNTTSLGMVGQAEFTQPINRASKKAIVVDIVYNPINTDFLKQAKELNLKTIGGIGMLINQAVPGFEHWFQFTPLVDDDIRKVIVEERE
ncbi:shikimate dehydrogenase [Paracoccaceae bacterium]|nr:shikimate dehydrogenase [Paracoccaceae bacterium]